jgi:hypothetical protein
VKNANQWYISDPVFSFVQRGLKAGRIDYRTGFYFDADEDFLGFELTNAPLMAKVFFENFSLIPLIFSLEQSSHFRSSHVIYWNSRVGQLKEPIRHKKSPAYLSVENEIWSKFLSELKALDQKHNLARDLFPPCLRKDGQKAQIYGNDFYVLLAENCSKLSKKKITELLEASWELFCCLYSREPLEKRDASLARSLRSAKIPRECEYAKILEIPNARVISKNCQGEIQGAHIKPHAFGGSDKATNGLWLCQYHHRATEGKLQGTRENIQFIN